MVDDKTSREYQDNQPNTAAPMKNVTTAMSVRCAAGGFGSCAPEGITANGRKARQTFGDRSSDNRKAQPGDERSETMPPHRPSRVGGRPQGDRRMAWSQWKRTSAQPMPTSHAWNCGSFSAPQMTTDVMILPSTTNRQQPDHCQQPRTLRPILNDSASDEVTGTNPVYQNWNAATN